MNECVSNGINAAIGIVGVLIGALFGTVTAYWMSKRAFSDALEVQDRRDAVSALAALDALLAEFEANRAANDEAMAMRYWHRLQRMALDNARSYSGALSEANYVLARLSVSIDAYNLIAMMVQDFQPSREGFKSTGAEKLESVMKEMEEAKPAILASVLRLRKIADGCPIRRKKSWWTTARKLFHKIRR